MNEIALGLGFALLAGLTVLALLRPLMRARSQSQGSAHLAFHRDQLEEIDRDLARGLLTREEADAARIDISRRLLAADSATVPESSNPALRRRTALAIMLAVPMITLAVYLMQGSPDLGDEPFSSRVEGELDKLPLEALVYRVSKQLKEAPDDLKGWEVIAPSYSDLGRYKEAAHAWARAIDIGGPTAFRLANLAEAQMRMGNSDSIGEDARKTFLEAEKLDPLEPKSQYYLGLAEIEDGKRAEAIARWQTLLDKGPKDAPWRAGIEASLHQLKANDAAADISNHSEAERDRKIEAMVSGLAARLEKSPDDIEGWLRLIKSYGVLQKKHEASSALLRARRIFASDKASLARLDAAEKELN